VSPETTDLELEKSPAENKMPDVLSFVALPPMLMKQPATVPVPVMLKVTTEEVVLEPEAAALNAGVGRLPEYVGKLDPPTSSHVE
jgi:hypothetical protein